MAFEVGDKVRRRGEAEVGEVHALEAERERAPQWKMADGGPVFRLIRVYVVAYADGDGSGGIHFRWLTAHALLDAGDPTRFAGGQS